MRMSSLQNQLSWIRSPQFFVVSGWSAIRKLGIRISIFKCRQPSVGAGHPLISRSGAYLSLWRIHALKCGSQVNAAEVTGGPSRVDWQIIPRPDGWPRG